MSDPALVKPGVGALGNLDLPLDLLNELDRSINATKWSVPIKSDGALPVLLTASIALVKQGLYLYVVSC